jgi:hypothetical protein
MDLSNYIAIIGIIIGSITSFVVIFIKIRHDNRKVLSKLESLSIEVKDIKEDSDDRKFRDLLSVKINSEASNIMNSKLTNNNEFRQMIKLTCQTGFTNVIEIILISQFSENSESVKSRLISASRIIAENINYNKLFIRRFKGIDIDFSLSCDEKELKKKAIIKEFYTSMKEEIILPVMKLFLDNYTNVSKLKNGTRRKRFEEIILNMISAITSNAIEKYKLFAQ